MHLRTSSRIDANIPVVSMADIAFLLIVFFMVTTVFDLEKGIDVSLPETREGAAKPKRNVSVTITKDHQVQVGENFVDFSLIQAELKERLKAESALTVIVRADRDLQFQFFADVVDEIKQAGVENVAFMTTREQQEW